MRTKRHVIAAFATAAVLAAGPVGCSGDDGGSGSSGGAVSSGGTGGGKDAADEGHPGDTAHTAYRDQLVAYLKGTSQGAHVVQAEVTKDKVAWGVVIDTDLPAYATTDYGAPQRDALDKLANETAIWLMDHRQPGIEIDGAVVVTVGRANWTPAPVPLQEQQPAFDALTADVVAQLRTRPEGAHVTRAWISQFADEATLHIATDLETYDTTDPSAYSAANRPRVEAGKALVAAGAEWGRKQTTVKITHTTLLDRDKLPVAWDLTT